MSAQAFHIVPKIEQVDTFLRERRDAKLFEAHPELSFAALNGGEAIRLPKRRTPGFRERYDLLAPIIGGEPLDGALGAYLRKEVARDDVLDAFAVLLTAQRILLGTGRRVPPEPVHDSAGLDMAIWY